MGLIEYSSEDDIREEEIEGFLDLKKELRLVALLSKPLSKSARFASLVRRRLVDGFVTLPLEREKLLSEIEHINHLVALQRVAGSAAASEEEDDPRAGIIGEHPCFRDALRALRKAAAAASPVLITGESGTGKELAALALHRWSKRRNGPFVAINCAGIPSQLIASELFGHEKGAFTDARERKLGKIEAASGGTLFLDEIGDLPLEMQGYLLRFIEEKSIERVGGTRPLQVDTRIVAATNVELPERVAAGRFRHDLYYRINILSVRLPPLRQRGEDSVILARHYLDKFGRELGRPRLSLTDDALSAIRRHCWPGNVRELIGVMSQAAVMAESDVIDAASLNLPAADAAEPPLHLGTVRGRADRQAIAAALLKNGENINRTARELGISRITLYRLIDKHSIVLSTRRNGHRLGRSANGAATRPATPADQGS